MSKMRPLVKTHGGKYRICGQIVALMNERFPNHKTYVEPFIGGGSVFANRTRRSGTDAIINDLDPHLINLYRHVESMKFIKTLQEMDYSEQTFNLYEAPELFSTKLERAIGYVVRRRMSRGGLGKSFAWSERLRGKRSPWGPVPGDLNAWKTFVNIELPAWRNLLTQDMVVIENRDVLEVIDEYKAKSTLFYCDPPYMRETRTAKKAYGQFEMTDAQHALLLHTLCKQRGGVILSGYSNPFYDYELRDWERIDIEVPNDSGQNKTKQRRVESLWVKLPK